MKKSNQILLYLFFFCFFPWFCNKLSYSEHSSNSNFLTNVLQKKARPQEKDTPYTGGCPRWTGPISNNDQDKNATLGNPLIRTVANPIPPSESIAPCDSTGFCKNVNTRPQDFVPPKQNDLKDCWYEADTFPEIVKIKGCLEKIVTRATGTRQIPIEIEEDGKWVTRYRWPSLKEMKECGCEFESVDQSSGIQGRSFFLCETSNRGPYFRISPVPGVSGLGIMGLRFPGPKDQPNNPRGCMFDLIYVDSMEQMGKTAVPNFKSGYDNCFACHNRNSPEETSSFRGRSVPCCGTVIDTQVPAKPIPKPKKSLFEYLFQKK